VNHSKGNDIEVVRSSFWAILFLQCQLSVPPLCSLCLGGEFYSTNTHLGDTEKHKGGTEVFKPRRYPLDNFKKLSQCVNFSGGRQGSCIALSN
jgi:hypothetical protein